jgi:predicted metal-dependent hydrolase
MPRNCSLRTLEDFLCEKREWILRALSRMPARTERSTIEEGDILPYLGRDLRVVTRFGGEQGPRVSATSTSMIVTLPQNGTFDLRSAVIDWLRARARARLPERVQELAADKDLSWGRLSLRDQRTLWASCSRKGTLSFNWRLILMPPEVMDYIILHELAHLKELNHSERFWEIVESWCPGYRRRKRWLRDNEALLRRW